MSKLSKFHDFIEQQNPEEKQRGIERVLKRERERLGLTEEDVARPIKKPFPVKRFWAICAPSLATVVLGISLFAFILPHLKKEDIRYCEASEYTVVESAKTLKEYGEEIEQDLLYFQWYTQTDYLKDYEYQLNDTQEIICHEEELVDSSTSCLISIWVTDNKTNLDIFNHYNSLTNHEKIKNTKVTWEFDSKYAYSTFEYDGYNYYLEVKNPIDEEYILELTEQLLP